MRLSLRIKLLLSYLLLVAIVVIAMDRITLSTLWIGLCGAGVLSYAVSRILAAPVKAMTEAVRQMASDNRFDLEIAPPSPEMRELSGALRELGERSNTRLSRIKEENARLEAVLAGMAEGVMVTGVSGRILMTNPSFRSMFGADDWCIGKRPIEIIRSHELQEAVDTAFKSDDPDRMTGVLEIVLPNTGQTLQIQLAPVRVDHNVLGMVAVFHDITALRRLERVRRDFVANVSHELRTPLTSIKGYTETLLDGALDDPKAVERFVQSIHKHAIRLQALVEDLLNLSRLESRGAALKRRPCDLGPLVQRALESLEHLFAGKRQRLETDIQPAPPVMANTELMEQVLVNLVDNAVKYTPEGGTIRVRLYDQGSNLHLEVEDTGVGIPSDALHRIFERFYRVDRARSRQMSGTGLGLSIVKHVVEIHGGRVWAESEVGRGSTFHVVLPVRRARETATP